MIRIPEYIQDDFRYLKLEPHFYCNYCKRYQARFIYLKFRNYNINFLFNCYACGEDFYHSMEYDQLRELFFRFTYSKETPDLENYWRMFRLGLWRDEIFQYEHDKDGFNKILLKLKQDTTGWRNRWNRRKYARKKPKKF